MVTTQPTAQTAAQTTAQTAAHHYINNNKNISIECARGKARNLTPDRPPTDPHRGQRAGAPLTLRCRFADAPLPRNNEQHPATLFGCFVVLGVYVVAVCSKKWLTSVKKLRNVLAVQKKCVSLPSPTRAILAHQEGET